MRLKVSTIRALLLLVLLMGVVNLIACSEPETDVSDEDEEEDKSGDTQQQTEPVVKPKFKQPKLPEGVHYAQYFNSPADLTDKLIQSESKKDGVDSELSKYDGKWSVEVAESSAIEGDFALVLKTKAKHAAVSSKLFKPFEFTDPAKQFVLQYEVKFQNGMECGGAYIKLLTNNKELNLKEFNDKTPYTIMFGPDKCGVDHKLHFILRHRNPISGVVEEKHAKKPKAELESYFSDKRTHLYTLVINSDNSYEIYVDRSLVNGGSLLEDMDPPVNPPKEIDDPEDKKPKDWDDREKIPDPKAKKPEDWDETQPEYVEDAEATMPQGWLIDEPKTVPDPKAEKPKDWDEDMDGSWEAPQIDNPKCKDAPGCGPWQRPKVKNSLYKGKWSAPMIDNPAYKGVWKPKKVANPNYFVDKEPWKFDPIGAFGFELWSMSDMIAFDNIIIVDRKSKADDFAEQTWTIKREAERQADPSSQSVVDAIRDATRDKPWIWAVLLLVVVLPTVLIIAYCCFRGGDSSSAASAASLAADARRKKTDEPERDDDDEEEEEEDVAAGEGGDSQRREAAVTKGSLEEEDDDDDDEEEEEEEKKGKADDVDLDAGDESAAAGTASAKSSGPRRRSARKE